MKVGIAGTGAVGGYVGGLLSHAGHEVTFLTRGKAYEYMSSNGLLIESENDLIKVQGCFTDGLENFSEVDLVIFSVKSNDTKEMASKLQPIIKNEAMIFTLQNGVDNEETLSQIFGRDRIISAAAYIQVHMKDIGIVKQIGDPPLFLIGAMNYSKNKDYIQYLCTIFNEANIKAGVSENIVKVKWKKLLWNVIFNPLSALIEENTGVILDDPGLLSIAKMIGHESICVARAEGIEVEDTYLEKIIKQAENARNHQTSMLQDKLKGKEMELESICGFIIKRGRKLHVPTPVLESIYHLLKFAQGKS